MAEEKKDSEVTSSQQPNDASRGQASPSPKHGDTGKTSEEPLRSDKEAPSRAADAGTTSGATPAAGDTTSGAGTGAKEGSRPAPAPSVTHSNRPPQPSKPAAKAPEEHKPSAESNPAPPSSETAGKTTAEHEAEAAAEAAKGKPGDYYYDTATRTEVQRLDPSEVVFIRPYRGAQATVVSKSEFADRIIHGKNKRVLQNSQSGQAVTVFDTDKEHVVITLNNEISRHEKGKLPNHIVDPSTPVLNP